MEGEFWREGGRRTETPAGPMAEGHWEEAGEALVKSGRRESITAVVAVNMFEDKYVYGDKNNGSAFGLEGVSRTSAVHFVTRT